MDAFHLAAVLDELEPLLAHRLVTKVEAVGAHGILLRFAGVHSPLYLSAHPELSRVGLVAHPPGIDAPFPAPDALAEPLRGASLERVDREVEGRVARFRFRRDADRHAGLVLVAELIPRFANLVLLGDEDRILWARREFPGAGRAREIRTGIRYVAPALAPGARRAEPPLAISADVGANEAADRLYRPREVQFDRERLLADLQRVLVRRRVKAAKALRHVEGRREEAGREGEIRRFAELLAAHLGMARRGMTSVSVPSFEGEGFVEVPLDPKLEPRANVEELFKRARRLARSAKELETQQSMLESEIAEADRAIARLGEPMSGEELRAFADAHISKRYTSSVRSAERLTGPKGAFPGRSRSDESSKRSLLPGFFPRRYVLAGGWEVFVGRNANQNDVLTHKFAAPRDLWFHARGSQGSHAVLRLASGKGEPPRAVIEAAAAIAAFHSKARNSKLVPVAYTERRHVRRPRGAPPGTASIQREKVIFVTPAVPEGSSDDDSAD